MTRDKGTTEPPSSPTRRRGVRQWMTLSVLLGLLTGVGTFTFGYGKGASYLSNNPKTCVNCHVMQDHFDSWVKSSHHHVADCNDCHLPHDFVGKWITKADNGFFHSAAFTLQDYRDPIQIKSRNRIITQNACLDCHGEFVHALLPAQEPRPGGEDMLLCVHCHSSVGHAFRPHSTGSERE
ncbi:MAG: cytochrome c nitrite reductase small subunit [Planctomycetota bacterium]